MAKQVPPLLSFNRGEVSKHALARVDVDKLRLAAETQENWLPFVLGPMMLRPGLGYVGRVKSDAVPRLVPFIFSNSDTALLECTTGILRVWLVSGTTETLLTRPSVSTAVSAGTFSSAGTWDLVTGTTSGATSVIADNVLTLTCAPVGGLASARQQVTVAVADRNVEHALRIVVTRGPITFHVGSTNGGFDLVSKQTLDTGYHSLSFTPTGDFYIHIESTDARVKIIDSCSVEASGPVEIPTTWDEDDLSLIRFDQSGDVIFCACDGQRQSKIERRSTRSWSVVRYYSNDGPFGSSSPDSSVTLTPAAYYDNTTLTADKDYFLSSHVGVLFRLFSNGQLYETELGALDATTPAIRVTGSGATNRNFSWAITGTYVGTLTIQRSFDSADVGFRDVESKTTATTTLMNDGLDNLEVWYRVKFTAYTSGSAVVSFTYTGGGAAGIVRITSIESPTVANIEILTALSSLEGTKDWLEGEWSDRQGWPSAVRIHEGRLWWAGRDKIWGSVSDNYTGFNIDTEGDSGPINRSVGSGPVDKINWLLSLTRMLVGREGQEASIRSSALDEPLTPTSFNIKDCSTQGSVALQAAKVDTRGVFVEKSNRKVYELAYTSEAGDYKPRDLTRLNLDIGVPGFADIVVQRQPDTMLHMPLDDGEVAILLYDVDDGVEAWWRLVTDGDIEAVAVLPGDIEDRVYYAVERIIDGVPRRYIEKLARRDECTGAAINKLADSFIVYEGVSTSTITGLGHLEGETVVAWGNSTDLGEYTVHGGSITLSEAVTKAVVGLSYTADFKSAKLAYAATMGTALTQKKRIEQIGLVLIDTHYQGIKYGQSFTTLSDMPQVKDGQTVAAGTVYANYDMPSVALKGTWDTDARLCLRATAPKPATVSAAIITIQTNEKAA
jgi:hypothetical protein